MKINIHPTDVEQFAGKLSQWAREVERTSRSIGTASRNLQSKWRDSNFEIFISTVEAKRRELQSTVQQFEELSKEMKIMAQELADMQRRNSRRLR